MRCPGWARGRMDDAHRTEPEGFLAEDPCDIRTWNGPLWSELHQAPGFLPLEGTGRTSSAKNRESIVRQADLRSRPIRDLTHSILNLSFAGKLRLLRGVLDGPVVVGPSTLVPHHDLENEEVLREIRKHTTMIIRHNQPLLWELLTDKHTTKPL